MKLVKLNDIFDIEYGNQLDLNKLIISKEGINFVSRSSKNLGVSAKVSIMKIKPYRKGLITVTLGGTYLLSSFIQPSAFYTAQNIKVLSPKTTLTHNEKIYYCKCIEKNRHKYTSHGREANKTLDILLVPSLDSIPFWVNKIDLTKHKKSINSIINKRTKLNVVSWEWFVYQDLFDIERGKGPRKKDLDGTGNTPFITSSEQNNGWTDYTNEIPIHQGNTITVNRNGSVAEAFYQPTPFCSTEDVHIFKAKFKLNKYIALFLTTLIRKEKYRFGYGRKWGIARMRISKIKLPVTRAGKPNWRFMENFIKSLPYSSNL